jgi:hypothetical protein
VSRMLFGILALAVGWMMVFFIKLILRVDFCFRHVNFCHAIGYPSKYIKTIDI